MKSVNYCKFQMAHRKGYSTQMVLLNLVNGIRRAVDKGRGALQLCWRSTYQKRSTPSTTPPRLIVLATCSASVTQPIPVN